ncbi:MULTISPECIES: HAMP domain-containing sensor histidine kinase [Clostridium]|uniref:sensor histidine kinase n=1 Tax=Clostridium TaxID=1485 RepID=UPI000C080231|nr:MULTISPECIES: HAMP domain-containing sensor histidine kinase [Clostridium]MDU1824931.1 HAMP domain-containing sensor histidine kinase [Clostridium sp.]MDU1843018.1 HAMP domain-containing sensor histidine kinase [Clostridium sp.]MDU2691902.1 HAMP domain-containing sensor histidine kinase [Clostridium sp.]MDU2958107.1 HAMP domain-containing sensor histidine kinase [Clostridium sp.]MDU3108641.1 HAMP domain-containing sensor histidine kinase [Clostridium sp.]
MNNKFFKTISITLVLILFLIPTQNVSALKTDNKINSILILTPYNKTSFDESLLSTLKSYISSKLPNTVFFENSILYPSNESVDLTDFDLIICLDSNRLQYIENNYSNFLDDTPVIIGLTEEKKFNLPENFGGYYMNYDFSKYMDFLLNIHPNLKKVNLLIGSNFKSSSIYKSINSYISKNPKDIKFNFITTGEENEITPLLCEKNTITIVFDSLLSNNWGKYLTSGSSYSTIRAISRKTTNEVYGGYREFITRFNIGGYNYDATVLAKAISDTAVSIINNTLSIKDVGYRDVSLDNDFIINTYMNDKYHLPTDLPNTSYIKIGSGETLIESSDSNKRNIIFSAIIIFSMFILFIYVHNKIRLRDKEKLDLMKNNFIANLSHELRNPLNIIISTIQLFDLYLKQNKIVLKDPTIKNKFEYLKNNSNRLLKLVNNVIDITKIDAGFFNISKDNYDIVSVVENLTLSTVPYAEYKDITLIFDTDIEELYCLFDKDNIERVILNLLSNALKFTPANGNIFVTLTYNSKYLSISVKDTGIGIPREKQKFIFDRFSQLDTDKYSKGKGSGIGLALIKSVVELHNGHIEVNSLPGVGSEFIVILPIYKVKNLTEQNGSSSDSIQKTNLEYSDIF